MILTKDLNILWAMNLYLNSYLVWIVLVWSLILIHITEIPKGPNNFWAYFLISQVISFLSKFLFQYKSTDYYCSLKFNQSLHFRMAEMAEAIRESLQIDARQHHSKSRQIPRDPLDKNRCDRFINFPNDLPEFLMNKPKEFILHKLIGEPESSDDPKRDQHYMGKFMNMINNEKFSVLDWNKLLPNHATLLDYLKADHVSTNGIGYQVPDQTLINEMSKSFGTNVFSLYNCQIKEVRIGYSSEIEIQEFITFVDNEFRSDQKRFPSGLLPLQVESIGILQADYDKLKMKLKKQREGKRKRFCESFLAEIPPVSMTSKCQQLPAKIIIGNGVTWMASICLPWNRVVYDDKETMFELEVFDMSKYINIFQWLKSFHAWTGFKIADDRKILQETLLDLYNLKIVFPKTLELSTLATAAGWRIPKTDAFTLSLLTTGTILNKLVGHGDNKWCKDFEKLPDSLKTYLIGDLSSINNICTVLLSLLIRNLFPDPSVVCRILDLDQFSWIEYFNYMIADIFADKSISSDKRSLSRSREELLMCISGTEDKNQELLDKFSHLIPAWPTVIHGGARYIHHARKFFLCQYEALKDICIQHPNIRPNLSKDLTDKPNLAEVTFDRDINLSIQIPGTRENGLVCLPEFLPNCFPVDPPALSRPELFEQAKSVGRNITTGFLEAICIQPSLVPQIFQILENTDLSSDDWKWWKGKVTFYDKIRINYRALTGKEPPVVNQLEDVINKKQHNVIREQKKAMNYGSRKQKKDMITSLSIRSKQGFKTRSNIQQQMHGTLPGNNWMKNRMNKEISKARKLALKTLPNFVPSERWKDMLSKGEVEDRTLSKAAADVDLRFKIPRKNSVIEKNVDENHQLQEEQEVTVSHNTPSDSDSTVRVIRLLESFDDMEDSQHEPNCQSPIFRRSQTPQKEGNRYQEEYSIGIQNQSPIFRRSSKQHSSRGHSPRSTLSNSPYQYSPRRRYRSPSPRGEKQKGIFEGDAHHQVEYQSPTFRGSLEYHPRDIQHSSPRWNSPNKRYRADMPGYYHNERSLSSTTTSGEYENTVDYDYNYHHRNNRRHTPL